MRSRLLHRCATSKQADITSQHMGDIHPSYRWTLMQTDQQRHVAEQFIQQIYAHQHNAQIQHFMPQLFALIDETSIHAVVGLRHALDLEHAKVQALFLERYLDMPAEQCLSQALGETVKRHNLVEIGQLSTNRPGMMALLLPRLFQQLHQQGARWLVFTATQGVRNSFRRLGLNAEILGEASVEALSAQEQALWGHYYQHRPLVMGGRLPLATPLTRSSSLFPQEAIA